MSLIIECRACGKTLGWTNRDVTRTKPAPAPHLLPLGMKVIFLVQASFSFELVLVWSRADLLPLLVRAVPLTLDD